MSCQILLHGQPTTFEQAIKEAMEIEYALNFETKAEPVKVINAVSNHNPLREPNVEMQLQKTLDQMTKCMESLEMKLQAGAEGTSDVHYSSRYRRSGNQKGSRVRYSQTGQVCWVCGESGHFKRDCPQLNYNGSAPSVGGWPRK